MKVKVELFNSSFYFNGQTLNKGEHSLPFSLAKTIEDNGWGEILEETKGELEVATPDIPEEGSDYEAELRAEIKALGGKAGGRSSIETLEKKLAQLKGE